MTVPKWDGEADTCPRYLMQLCATAEYYNCGNAMDAVKMRTLPTKSEYETLEAKADKSDEDKAKISLYKQNKRMCAVIVLGQGSDYGLSVITKTKSAGNIHGRADRFVSILEKKNKPSDAAAEIELDNDLDKLTFQSAQTFYMNVMKVTAKYKVDKSETDLVKVLMKKVTSPTYSKMILEHLRKDPGEHDLEAICDEISEIQRTTKPSGGYKKASEKEVQLPSAANSSGNEGNFRGVCGFCNKVCGYKRKDCPLRKAAGGSGGGGGGGGGGRNSGGGGNSNKTCNCCGKKGHVEADCWVKHPDKAPKWFKDLQAKKEASGTTIEMMLASIEYDSKKGEVMTSSSEAKEVAKHDAKANVPAISELLHELNMAPVLEEVKLRDNAVVTNEGSDFVSACL